MHFCGVLVRRPNEAQPWRERFESLVATESVGPRLARLQLGACEIVYDDRLTRCSAGDHGVIVNTGALLAGADIPFSDALRGSIPLSTVLVNCRGNFAGAWLDAAGRNLVLFSDLLGTHPLYYCSTQGAVFFSTSERVLVSLLRGSLSIDQQGLLEICTFGFPLAERTAYREIRCMDAAQILRVDDSGEGTAVEAYFPWRSLDIAESKDIDQLADRTHAAFTDAIRRREQPGARSITLLSGGMDSRAILAVQTENGARPDTVSISHPKALDAELARQVAGALGSPLSFHPIEHSAYASVGGLAAALHDILARSTPANAPSVRVWSGDGGSVGLGGVYLSTRTLDFATVGDLSGLASKFLAENGLAGPSKRLFVRSLDAGSFAARAMLGELKRFKTSRLAQIPYLFLMLNDQRRHLHYFFELKLRAPFEFVTPFWDSEFLRTMLECPDHEVLYHRFYSRFFEKLPSRARSVPWQTYPGHAPCPLPLPDGFDYNWDHAPREADLRDAHERARGVLRRCVSADFPTNLLRRSMAAAAAIVVLRSSDPDRAYLVHHAEIALRHFDATDGIRTRQ